MQQALQRSSLVPSGFVVDLTPAQDGLATEAAGDHQKLYDSPMIGPGGAITDTPASSGNLERRRIVTLLPDREPATAQAWLAAHPTTAIVARDRGGGCGEAAAKALPHAIQVADRWHRMENASRAFLDAVRKSMRQIRSVIGATTIDPKLLTAAERLQDEGYLRREETNAAILALSKSGTPIKQIVRQTGYSKKLVRQVTRRT